MIVIVQPISAGTRLVSRAAEASYRCLVPTSFPDQVPAHDNVQPVQWNPVSGVDGLLRCVERADEEINGVIAGFEYVVAEAAGLAAAVGCPGLSEFTTGAVRNKDLMRSVAAAQGIAVPRSVAVDTVAEPPLPLPVVVKPADWGGSLGVRLASTREEYAAGCAAILTEPDVRYHHAPRRTILVEEFVEAAEFSIEGWVDPAGVHVVGITRKFTTAPPRFFEIGHVTTAPAFAAHGALLADFAADVVRAFEITTGSFHIEAFLRDDGPTLVEVGARLGGDQITDLVLSGPGIDLCLAAVDAAIGRAHEYSEPSEVSAGVAFVTATRSGRFAGLDGLDAFRDEPEFDSVVDEVPVGTAMDPDDIFANRAAAAFFTGDAQRVELLVDQVLYEVRVQTDVDHPTGGTVS
ncbi:MAG: ATP-grasp domain-containing protein [Nocardioides sp.]